MEIERKYLVRELPPDVEDFTHCEIEQGYICKSPTLRVRRMGDMFILTVKQGCRTASTAIVNREEEFALTEDKYRMLLGKCDGRILHKTRYRIPLTGGLVAELDIFHGCHEGLRIVEVEFPDVESADAFVPPAWFGEDVSGDPSYRNSSLAG